MRTTVTIDDDVASALAALQREHGYPFRQVLNEALRAGLRALDAPNPEPSKDLSFTKPVSLGEPLIDITDVSRAVAFGEGDSHR